MQMTGETSRRIGVVIEKNRSGTWSAASYLANGDGPHRRRALGTFETPEEAIKAIRIIWEAVKRPEAA